MNVSVITPARNASQTIAETLESLRAQTFAGWEAIVIDDGSEDGTSAIVQRFVDLDHRIRLVKQSQMGEAAARNKGIELARGDWLLFLDADDWILPRHLERLAQAVVDNPSLDVAYCLSARVTPDGTTVDKTNPVGQGDLFPLLARNNQFAIHSCIVRRPLVQALGGFDSSFQTCEDWDLWQRIARTGALFGVVPEVLAHYRMRPDSLSVDGRQLFKDGLRVIAQGHSLDPRVPNPSPAYLRGPPTGNLANARLLFACSCAGLVLGRGEDATSLLRAIEADTDPRLDPYQVARNIFHATPLPSCRPPASWMDLVHEQEGRIRDFLLALERQSRAPGLARRAASALETMVLEHSAEPLPSTVGMTHAIRLEVTEPVADIVTPAHCERLQCTVELEGTWLSTLELPICDGLIPGPVLADAVAARLGWPILERFFEQTIYPELRIEQGATGLLLWRGNLLLAEGLPEQGNAGWSQVHARIGWTVFLQELWGRPNWLDSQFYDPRTPEEAAPRRCIANSQYKVEISEEIPDLEVQGQEIDVLLTVGGAAIGIVRVAAEQNTVSAQQLRAALTATRGSDLLCAAVREGLLGRPLQGPPSLRERLAASAAQAAQQPAVLGIPGAARAIGGVLSSSDSLVVFGRRLPREFGTSCSRRAALPIASVRELIESAAVAGEPFVHIPSPGRSPTHAIYAPDLIRPVPGPSPGLTSGVGASRAAPVSDATIREPSPSELATGSHPGSVGTGQRRRAAGFRGTLALVRAIRIARAAERARAQDQTAAPPALEAASEQLPILLYHRVAPTGSPATVQYRVTPEAFEEQLVHLRGAGYHSVSLEEWRAAMKARRPLPGRALLITFDDGCRDFLTHAWPLLKRYGFSALVFLVADEIGNWNRWDRVYGEKVPLLGWREIRQLQDEGVAFGSHSARHAHLQALSPAEVVREGARSRAIIQQGLGVPVRAFAYPHGGVDAIVEHLIGACGYVFGLSCRPGRSTYDDALLALPRIEVNGSDSVPELMAKIGA